MMDLATKRRRAEVVRRGLSRKLHPHGFERSKPTFWTRVGPNIAEYVHLHLFSHAPLFRVHLGIRVMNDDFPAVALNGLHTPDGWFGVDREYQFGFADSDDSVAACVDHLWRFCADVGFSWFESLAGEGYLVNAPDSPLNVRERDLLKRALSGDSDPSAVRRSKALLGVA